MHFIPMPDANAVIDIDSVEGIVSGAPEGAYDVVLRGAPATVSVSEADAADLTEALVERESDLALRGGFEGVLAVRSASSEDYLLNLSRITCFCESTRRVFFGRVGRGEIVLCEESAEDLRAALGS